MPKLPVPSGSLSMLPPLLMKWYPWILHASYPKENEAYLGTCPIVNSPFQVPLLTVTVGVLLLFAWFLYAFKHLSDIRACIPNIFVQ